MKPRLVVLICLFNLTLLGVGYFWLAVYFNERPAREGPAAGLLPDGAQAHAAPAAAERALPAAPVVIYKTNQLQWSQLESSDYRQYIANLRAVGCPEATVRDIIITDVMRLYAARRGKFYQNGRAFKYWETDEKRKLKQTQLEEREAQLALIDKELPAILRELLGINYEREVNKYFVDAEEDDRRLAFLSEDKRARILALRDQFEGRREQVLWEAPGGKPTPGQIEQLRQIDREQDAALAGAMTAEERYEFELTTSPTADRMRRELIGFNPTEAEFRQIFAREQALDTAYAYQDTNDPDVRAAQAADEQKMTQDLQTLLGPDRFAQFEQTGNPDYQSLTLLAERFDLPPDVSQTVLDMRRLAEEARSQLLSNQDIPADRRNAALNAIQAEAERATRQTLGDKAYDEYTRSATWIRGLGAN
jgi:tRNA U38,U39,U40 pseudouridine synthase TruA